MCLQLCTEPFSTLVFVLSISDASGTLAGKSLTKFCNILMKLSEIGSKTGLNIREMVSPCMAVVEASSGDCVNCRMCSKLVLNWRWAIDCQWHTGGFWFQEAVCFCPSFIPPYFISVALLYRFSFHDSSVMCHMSSGFGWNWYLSHVTQKVVGFKKPLAKWSKNSIFLSPAELSIGNLNKYRKRNIQRRQKMKEKMIYWWHQASGASTYFVV